MDYASLRQPPHKKKSDPQQHPTAQRKRYQSYRLPAPDYASASPYMDPRHAVVGGGQASAVHGEIIDERKLNRYTFCTELWNPECPNDFFSHWIKPTHDYDAGDGPKTFANNLLWMRRLAATHKMYIAYAADTEGTIVIATCVLVQPGSVYATSGTSFANGVIVRDSFILEQYVAAVVAEKIDPRTKGLLFRPGARTRRTMLDKLGHAVEGESSGGMDQIGGCVGSDFDKRWFYNAHPSPGVPDTIRDYSPSIMFVGQRGAAKSNAMIKIRRFVVDHEGIYLDRGWHAPIQAPFWEPPSAIANPDSINNPQIPLVFFPIQTLLSP